jgi:ribonucleoside-diphosphate reductase alpha chain
MSALAGPALSEFIWRARYRSDELSEQGIADTWRRVSRSVAAIEPEPEVWAERFAASLRDFRFLPAGRILAGAGTTRQVTLFNCFVMGLIDDSVEGIFEALKEGALTMQQGGGVGYDFSTLRPRGSRARATGAIASGPVSFMRVWDAMCATILSTGARRGAMMATLRCDHPDIEEFIDAKRAGESLQRFNLSVLVTDAFMRAVADDAAWPLVFPERALGDPVGGGAARRIERAWSGARPPVSCRVLKEVRARELWQRLCASAYASAEPGVLFIDRINADNNLGYCEDLSATNPCAEEPLPPFGGCNLGSLNLTAFVRDPFGRAARLDHDALRETARVAVRFLDDVIEISRFPLYRQREQVHRARRIGLGITGLGDALAMLGLRYESAAARAAAGALMRTIRDAAYESSVELARERGPFPAFDAQRYLERPFIRTLPERIQTAIARHGTRNSHLLAIAPAGTISLLAGNVSSGIEPLFGLEALRRVLDCDGRACDFHVTDYAYATWRASHPQPAPLPEYFVSREAITPRDQLLMQAALQPCVDGAISKTVALARELPDSAVPELFELAYELNLKGCAVFREEARAGVIGTPYPAGSALAPESDARCCDTQREGD